MRIAGQTREFAQLMRRLLLWGPIILFPIAVVTWFGADIIIDLLLRRGRFGAYAARVTADSLRGFAPAIVFEAGIVILFRAFNALHLPRAPVAVALVTLACLIGLMRLSASHSLTASALALSAALGIALIALLARLASVLGLSAILDGVALARWCAGSLVALGIAWLFYNIGTGQHVLLVAGIFLITYAIAIFCLLPGCRREAHAFIRGLSLYEPENASTRS
jgi:peptidoglycan biosynthesis protein MviN/MurJ (putative lipid II flippase)